MGPNESIEPIHKMDAEDLEHVLEIIWDDMKALYANREVQWPPLEREILEKGIVRLLRTIADSIKKSLITSFPKFEKDILRIINAREARLYHRIYRNYYPLDEGIRALINIYAMIVTYGIDRKSVV